MAAAPSTAELTTLHAEARSRVKRALREAQAANVALAQLEDKLRELGIGLTVIPEEDNPA